VSKNNPQAIAYGTTLRIRHVATGALLTSLDRPYVHAGTSHQHMVGGTAKCDESTLWLVKPPDAQKRLNLDNHKITDGAALRLEHIATRRNLHSHNAPAPISGPSQFEVTAFYDSAPGDGDVQDDWVLSLGSAGEWIYGKPFRLRHTRAGGWSLHSHGIADPSRTGGLFEVTAVPGGDANDLFVAEPQNLSVSTDGHFITWVAGRIYSLLLPRLWQACVLVTAAAGITWLFVDRAIVQPLNQQMEIQRTTIEGLNYRVALVKEEREAQKGKQPENKPSDALPTENTKRSHPENPPVNVSSTNQSGGITAANVNLGQPQRAITPAFEQELLRNIAGYKKVEVTCVLGDGEAFQFATAIVDYLKRKGTNVEGVNQAAFTRPVVGQIAEANGDAIKLIIGTQQR